jgi:DNA-binding MarR family transcriptional regulator
MTMNASLRKPQAPPTAVARDGRFSVWFGRTSRTLAQQMVLYARRELGLNLAEYRTLDVLAECGSASIKDIATGADLDKSQITRAVADLTKRGLVIHAVDGRDRRLRAVKLTRAGSALVAKSIPFSVERQRRLEQALSPAELRILWKALAIVFDEARAMLSELEREEVSRAPKHGRARRTSA